MSDHLLTYLNVAVLRVMFQTSVMLRVMYIWSTTNFCIVPIGVA